MPNESPSVHSSKLVQHNVPVLPTKAAGNPKRVRMATSRHGSDQECANVTVQFVRRDDHAWPCSLDLFAPGWIERHEINIAAKGNTHLQTHSESSKSVDVGSSSRPSSPLSWSCRAASSHPALGAEAPSIMRPDSTTFSHISSPSPASSIRGFGIRTPRELPIRISLVFMPSARSIWT